jgi:phosphoglycolate phosphatase
MKKEIPDSLIFDMDGTLWDAVDTYVVCWNKALERNGRKRITRAALLGMMGWEKEKVISHYFHNVTSAVADEIFEEIVTYQDEIIPHKGGKLYDDVYDGIKTLASKYKLFILSNCPPNTIKQFVQFAKIEKFITDHIAHGYNLKPKHFNMQLLKDKHGLENPFYIGDTLTDSTESKKAKLPFVFVSYGFGEVKEYDFKFDDFKSLVNYFDGLK